jgi:hypothetical protein
MDPTVGDWAEFAAEALNCGLIGRRAVVAWADAVITATDGIAPAWAIDLSLVPDDPHELLVRLRQVEGPRGDAAMWMLMALIARRWFGGELTMRDVARIGWHLHFDDRVRGNEDLDWGIQVDDDFDMLAIGHMTEADVRASIDETLNRFQDRAAALPAWVEVK